MTDKEALTDFLLELLTSTASELLATPEGREDVALTYEQTAKDAHPAVASVLRRAAAMVRGGGTA